MTVETNSNPAHLVRSSQEALQTLMNGAGCAPIVSLGFIQVTGEDRVRWLNGMVTNSIQELKVGEGCYNFFLNAQGRIQADATAWMLADSILLETSRAQIPALIAHLDHFIIMDDVELTDVTMQKEGLLVTGFRASDLLGELNLVVPAPLQLRHTLFQDHPVDLLHAYGPLAERFEIWAAPQVLARVKDALQKAGASDVDASDLEALRVLEGMPLYGRDIREKELPQETAQTRALHFAKGCYLGQEIVERIRSRGNVHRTFCGFTLTGLAPVPGTSLFVEDPAKPVGELTSVAEVPLAAGSITLALGYVRREALEASKLQGKPLLYSGGAATPSALPFPYSPEA